jgi:hypothetical protein
MATVTYLSLMELARKAGISYPTALKLVANRIIEPDATSGRTKLFSASRWEELRGVIRKNVAYYGAGRDFDFITKAAHPLNFQ